MRASWIPALLLLGLLIAFRCLGATFSEQLPNFSPLPAIFLCSVVFFRGKAAWMLPLGAWLISNPLASLLQGYSPFGQIGPVLTAFLTLLALGFLAIALRKHSSAPVMLAAGLGAALLFHLVTGVVAWIADPRYVKTLLGLQQALWTGVPGDLLPSWVFLRNLAAANLLFTALFLAARHSWSPSPSPAKDGLAQTR